MTTLKKVDNKIGHNIDAIKEAEKKLRIEKEFAKTQQKDFPFYVDIFQSLFWPLFILVLVVFIIAAIHTFNLSDSDEQKNGKATIVLICFSLFCALVWYVYQYVKISNFAIFVVYISIAVCVLLHSTYERLKVIDAANRLKKETLSKKN